MSLFATLLCAGHSASSAEPVSDAEPLSSIPQALQAAKQLQSDGALLEAKRLYQSVLRHMPGQPEALTLLGSIAFQLGQERDGERLLDSAIENYATIFAHGQGNDSLHAAYVNMLLARGRRDEAEREIAKPKLPINPIRSTPEAFRARVAQAKSRGLPGVLLNSLPKSASESIWNRLAEGLGMAQGHVSLGLFPDCCLMPYRLAILAEGGLIAKEHIPANSHNLRQLREAGIDRMLLNLRDPRQASLSWAHFVKNDVSMRLMAPIWRKIVPPRQVLESDFGQLLDWVIDFYLPLAVEWIAEWTKLSQRDNDAPLRVYAVKFETFRNEPERYFEGVLDFLEIDRQGFAMAAEAQTVHLRRGALEEWREVLTPAQAERAWTKLPKDLAGYWGWTA